MSLTTSKRLSRSLFPPSRMIRVIVSLHDTAAAGLCYSSRITCSITLLVRRAAKSTKHAHSYRRHMEEGRDAQGKAGDDIEHARTHKHTKHTWIAVSVPMTPTEPPMKPLCQWCFTLCSTSCVAMKSTSSDPGKGGNPSPALKLRTPRPHPLRSLPPPPPPASLLRLRRGRWSVVLQPPPAPRLFISFAVAPAARAPPLPRVPTFTGGCRGATKASAAGGLLDHSRQRTRRVRITQQCLIIPCILISGKLRTR